MDVSSSGDFFYLLDSKKANNFLYNDPYTLTDMLNLKSMNKRV